MMRWLLLLAACSHSASTRTVHVPLTPHVVHLDNGLTAILVPDRTAEQAQISTIVRVGFADDTTPGIAHLAAHLSYVPTTEGLTRWDRLDKFASSIGAQPSLTRTTFDARFAPSHLGDVLQLEAQRLSVPCDAATTTWLDRERGQVAGEVRADVNAKLQRDTLHAIFADADPRARAFDATPESVMAIPQDQTCAFIARYYVPANATIVVWGPYEPAGFEATLRAQLAAVPAGTANPRTDRATISLGTQSEITTDVAAPTLAIAYQLPTDAKSQELMKFALELLAVKTQGHLVATDDLMMLWYTPAEGALAKLTAAVESGLVDPKDFESVRTRRATERLLWLDAHSTRLTEIAASQELDAPFAALSELTSRGLAQYVVSHLGLVHARVVKMTPNGKSLYPNTFGPHGHELRGPSNYVDAPAPAAIASETVAAARTLKLANGMTVVMMPTSSVPVVRLELAFFAGAADETGERTGAAYIAAGALEEAVARVHPETSWVAGLRSSKAEIEMTSVILQAPSVDADLLLEHLDAVQAPLLAVDQQKRRDEMAAWPTRPETRQLETLFAAIFGADHPYGQRSRTPSTAVTPEAVAAFARSFFQPNNAELVITGGFDPAALEPVIHRVFDGWQGHATLPAPVPMHMAPTAFASEDGPSVALEVDWQGAPIDERYEARELLAYLLSSETGTRVDYNQFRQGGLYRLSASYDPRSADLQVGETLSRIVKLASAPENVSFRVSKKHLVRWFVDSGSSVDSWSHLVLLAAQNGRDTHWLADSAKRYAAVTYADLAALIREEMMTGRLVITLRGPRAVVDAIYAALGSRPIWM